MSNLKSRHAFGSEANIASALEQGLIDAYDVLFLDEGKIGWIDKNGVPVIPETDASEVKEQVEELSKQVANVESTLSDYGVNKYEVTSKPAGTLVDYREKEVRVMCPADTTWVKQNVGTNGNANMYYMGFKAYAPEGAVSFKEDDLATIEDQTMYYFEGNDFAGVDSDGRKYSIVWLALASYDEATDSWTYFGAQSTTEKYIGWYYSVEWYDKNGDMIASDCIRINLTNENCHSAIEPYYVAKMMSEVEAKIAEVSSTEVVEF